MRTSVEDSQRSQVNDRLLRRLPADEFARLKPHLQAVPLWKRHVLVSPNAPIEAAYFLESGLASVISHAAERRRVEIGLFGRDGMVGVALVLGSDRTPHETAIQVEGSGLRIDARELVRAMAESAVLHGLLTRFSFTHMLMVAQTALSNGSSSIEERLARWLLLAHDRIDGDDLPLTHEFLSVMLCTRRPSVTLALHVLEGAGMVKARRGLIRILDRDKLEELAGDTYGDAEREYERLIRPFR